jgi:bacillithiol biosynthesis cysteine-adding enzyme BshC
MKAPTVITEPLGGSSLADAAMRGVTPDGWYVPRPRGAEQWADRARTVRSSANADWLDALRPAFGASGRAAERLAAAAGGKGVLITTGQQPGLFGGPLYTWSKALSAIALAESLEEMIAMPVVPVFWAATDDADFVEASWTIIARAGGADEVRLPGSSTGQSMADIPLGDVSRLLDRVEHASGSSAWLDPLHLLRGAYRPEQTIGGAYLQLLRGILEPLGMPVLDAAHPSVRRAGSPLLREALRRSERIAAAVAERERALTDAGHTAQVASVPGLSLVFHADAERQRIRHADARTMADTADAAGLSPNVLLRPVVERAILPTVAYVAGPAEIAYFAQVSAVADALDAATPLAVPRWSCTILEPHVEEILSRFELRPEDLRDPHAAETRLAKERLPEAVTAMFARVSGAVDEGLASLGPSEVEVVGPRAVEGARRALQMRLARFQRRYTAAMKRRLGAELQDIGTARGSLFPGGKRQERALNLIPLLARYGRPLLAAMQAEATLHVAGLIDAQGDMPVRSSRVTQPTSA